MRIKVNLLTWVRSCACGRVHIDVWPKDGQFVGDVDADIVKALRDAARQIERKTATRTPGTNEHHH